jgi:hypothetical protein
MGKLKVWKYQEQDCSTVLEHVDIHFHIIKAPADELETKLEEGHAFRANKQKYRQVSSQQRVHLLPVPLLPKSKIIRQACQLQLEVENR